MRAALLFDLDGTLLHSDPIHIQVFAELLAGRGVRVDEAFYNRHVLGRMNTAVFAEFLPDEPDPHGLSDHKEALFRARLPRPFPAMPGIGALLDRAEAEGIALAVVTNANPLNAEAMLAAIGLRSRFAHVVSGETCARGKPHPDPYLEGLRRTGASAARALAFEDSPAGIRAAVAAGIRVIGLRSSLPDAALRAAGAMATIQDFTDPALGPILTELQGAPA